MNTAEMHVFIQDNVHQDSSVGVHMQITADPPLNASMTTPHRAQFGSVVGRMRLQRGYSVEANAVGTCRALPERRAGQSTVTTAGRLTLNYHHDLGTMPTIPIK